jgi:hypothetical protein
MHTLAISTPDDHVRFDSYIFTAFTVSTPERRVAVHCLRVDAYANPVGLCCAAETLGIGLEMGEHHLDGPLGHLRLTHTTQRG